MKERHVRDTQEVRPGVPGGAADRPGYRQADRPGSPRPRINAGTLGNWVAKDRAEREGTQGLSTGDMTELKRLRAEVAELRMERDVLNRSVGQRRQRGLLLHPGTRGALPAPLRHRSRGSRRHHGLVPRPLQRSTPAQLCRVAAANRVRKNRCHPTGGSTTNASTISGEAQRSSWVSSGCRLCTQQKERIRFVALQLSDVFAWDFGVDA